MLERFPSTYAVLAQHGVDRRTFFKYCTSLAAIMGLEATIVPKVMAAMESKPRIPVIWLKLSLQQVHSRP
jgi:hydrogenase small subunit